MSIAACEALLDRLMAIAEEYLDRRSAEHERRLEKLKSAARQDALEQLVQDGRASATDQGMSETSDDMPKR